MKKLLSIISIIILLFTVSSCCNEINTESKFKQGDYVVIVVDNREGIVIGVHKSCSGGYYYYTVKYGTENTYKEVLVRDFEIKKRGF